MVVMVVVTLNQIKKRGRKRATLMDERSVKTLISTFSPDFCTPIFVEGGAERARQGVPLVGLI
jgi:hypothetical protein